MTPHKTLLEQALKLIKALDHLPLYEKQSVLLHMGTMLQTEAKSIELAQMQNAQNAIVNAAAPPLPADEHFRA